MNEFHYLEIESVVTAGNVRDSEARTQSLEERIQGLPLRQQQSERARIGFNDLLKSQRVLSRCSFGLVLNAEQTGYQRIEHGPHVVEIAARLIEFDVRIETGENEISADIAISATYDTIGGSGGYTPKHLPMILGHWYGLGGCGNARTYLTQVARLCQIDSVPTRAMINERTMENQMPRMNVRSSRDHRPLLE